MSYVEFACASNFSFLRGASHPEELALQADAIGIKGLGLCDRNLVAGVVRAHVLKREKELPLRYHPGVRLVFADDTPDILAYPRDRPAWGRLCRLLTRGNLRAEKGECILYISDLLEFIEGLELIVMPESTRDTPPEFLHHSRQSFAEDVSPQEAEKQWRTKTGVALQAYEASSESEGFLARLKEAAPGCVRLAARMLHRGRDRADLAARAALARKSGLPLIAVNDVLYHHPDRRELQDVLTCIRHHVTIDTAGHLLAANAERHLKPPEEMARLFRDYPEAVEETLRLDAVLTFSLDELQYEYPLETREGFATPQEALEHYAWEGAAKRYGGVIPDKIQNALKHELNLIASRQYAPYFLTVHDVVRYARSQGILCQGRGSAANSAVCYCLEVTEVDPNQHELLFERFISDNRNEPPDIDVDFEHERREEVIQYIYDRYGRERTGIAATVISYRGRSAGREIGKVFGLSEDTIGALSSSIWGMGGGSVREGDLARVGIDLSSPRMQKMQSLLKEIRGFPRHLSQHVGGFVMTQSRLDEVVPLMNGGMDKRTHVEWDKDDLDALRILKVDVLGLGMLTCIEKSFRLLEKHYGEKQTISSIRAVEEEPVYKMLWRADSLGVFQVESRAQMTMLPRLRPKEFYDLVIEVAIVRPGPIQGNMVHPYLRRRMGKEKTVIPSPKHGDPNELKQILARTFGVPLFQEQAMKIAIVAGGFTPAEADQLRRAMATFRRMGTIGNFRDRMVKGMVAKGYEPDFAERCFSQIEGFGEYGFPESHAASFAILVYVSAWLKCRYPDVFAAALLNSQPLGFYSTSQIVRDAREHGVELRPVDVNFSNYDSTLEPGQRAAEHLHPLHEEMREDIRSAHAIRLGLREIKGMNKDDTGLIERHRGGGYDSIRDLWLRTGLDPSTLTRLAEADAFGSLGLSRREALWACQALRRTGDKDDLPLLALAEPAPHLREPDVSLPAMPPGQEVVEDYRTLRLSLRQHPIEFVRGELDRHGVVRNEVLRQLPTGRRVIVGGLVLIRQRPGSASGVIFMTLEDESGIANAIVWPAVFERYRPEVLGGRLLLVKGEVQNEENVVHVVAKEIIDATGLLAGLGEGPVPETLSRADEVKHPQNRPDHRGKNLRQRLLEAAVAADSNNAAELVQAAPGSAHKPARRGKLRAAHPPRLDPSRAKAPWPKGRNFH
jgi:DNA-directed DNA polymerase III PolC